MANAHKARKRILVVLLIFIGGGCVGTIAGILFAVTNDLPQIRSLEEYRPSAVTRVYSADQVLLTELYVEKRDPVPLADMPPYLTKAIIATEDRAFYRHNGVDLKGILRAAVKDVLSGRLAEGASTITQQLSKTLFLTPEKTFIRKIKEAFLSFQLERRYTKDEILALYLNQIYFGSGAHGVESAARVFFGKSVRDLDLAECALIAGMPKRPSRYSPLISPEMALNRRSAVLRQMRDVGHITSGQYEDAVNQPLVLNTAPNALQAPYFLDYAKSALESEEEIGGPKLYRGGLTITTTLSYRLQSAAERAVAKGLALLDDRIGRKGEKHISPQCALISLAADTGALLAMVGGRNYGKSRFNRATQAKRQPGSAFKPIVYAYAVDRGIPQSRGILDAPVAFKGPDGRGEWRPRNYSGEFLGEISLRHALAVSRNVPAVRLLEELGPPQVIAFGRSLGIETPLSADLTLALGSSEMTLINLVSVYAVFANGGRSVKPFGISSVTDARGRFLYSAIPHQKAVLSEATAAVVTDMLKAVIQEGSGRKARILHRPVAGKTGTSTGFKDALFIGYSPSIVTGVWVGTDDYVTLGEGESGSKAALPIWIDYMSAALDGASYDVFPIPEETVRIPIDPVTGKSPAEDSSSSVDALFTKGSVP